MVATFAGTLPAELRHLQVEMEGHARAYGLDFFDVIFEQVGRDELNAIAALGGFPNRYPHWRFGMEYEQLSKGYSYGLSKIYELVINNDPCYAYLLDSNALVDQKLVMAHVYGHCDFFKNNVWFARTNRKMMDDMANHGNRIRQYMDRHGESTVEDFIDITLSVEDLIDMHAPFIKRRSDPPDPDQDERLEEKEKPLRFESKEYMDSFINPKAVLAAEAERLAQEEKKRALKVPPEPEKDILWFLMEHGNLKAWQRDLLSVIREEAYYFAPQGQTKILNEGWASYWHSTIMCERGLTDAEVVDFADHHSGTMAMSPGSFNPYKIGLELLRDIEDRWNKGRFGKEFHECNDMAVKRKWDQKLGLGRQKIFEVRQIHNDVTFIDTFLTAEFCREHRLFAYAYNQADHQYEIESRNFEAIKERLLFQLTNHGRPFIYVTNSNYRNRKELYLTHRYIGVELRLDYARDVLVNLQKLWSRPVHVETVVEDRPMLLSYDGTEHTIKPVEAHEEVSHGS